jgi:hypothetical protein
MLTYTGTETRTRTDAVHDQFHMFLLYAGVQERVRDRLLNAVQQKWVTSVGVYLLNNSAERILEAEVAVRWELHSDLAVLEPTVRTDLPGWDRGAAPEIQVIGGRFGRKAQELGRPVHSWVLFTSAIRSDPGEHERLCERVGISLGSPVPKWASGPQTRSYTIDAVREVNVYFREA